MGSNLLDMKGLLNHSKTCEDNKAQPRWKGYISGYSNSFLKIEQRYKKKKLMNTGDM